MTEVISVDKKPNWFKRHKVWTTAIIIFVFFSLIGAIGGDDDKKATSATGKPNNGNGVVAPVSCGDKPSDGCEFADDKKATETSATPPAATIPAPTAKAATPAPAPAPAPTPAAPTTTVSQRNALAKAKNYLGYTAFSHDGLVDQLVYEQFSTADSTYGADNVGADWNAQAAKKAKSYMEYSSFSRGSLIDQLKYDKFTQAQAEFGASSAGL